ncbi:DUF2249 domain-containing protein [Gordonia sp. (in: high G+C Gram-positive bacteria)]|uniref:DUF2249 domain-containing protein n=1 Tax=Gordonia sp. (in: high G+C Gram-positive bacteria) TaxID=84139 RepID=UPI003F960D0C
MTSNDMTMASNAADADALEQQRQAIAELTGRMSAVDSAVLRAAASGAGLDEARTAASAFASNNVGAWLDVAQRRLFPEAAAVDHARLLVDGLAAESRMLTQLVERVNASGSDAVHTAVDVSALRVLAEAFFGNVGDLLLPALAEDASVSLADLITDLPAAAPAAEASGSSGCSCGEHDHGEPELDVREIPHAIRHATVFGAFDAVAPGESMILVAHHDPVPLLHQLADRSGGHIRVEYLEQGPEAWRLRLSRV